MWVDLRRKAYQNRLVVISCIVPVYNESVSIQTFLQQLLSVMQRLTDHYEIIVIDDGSQDTTCQKIHELHLKHAAVKLLSLSRNFGKEIALTAGLEHAKGDVAIMMDADFQHPMDLIPTFLSYWSEGFDMVYGVRRHRHDESRLKRMAANGFYWLMSKIAKVDLPAHAGDFRLLDRKVIHQLNAFQERIRFMKGLYAWVGFKKIALEYEVNPRLTGKSRWNFSKLTELALTGITSFSDIPLRISSFFGLCISLLSLFYAGYIIAKTLIYGADLPGFPTLAVAIMFFGGIQLLSIGILGEYVAQIFTEVKTRPKYIIDHKMGFNSTHSTIG